MYIFQSVLSIQQSLTKQNLGEPQKVAYYLASAAAGIPVAELVRVAGLRWTVERCFQSAKGEVGPDHYEVRTWQGWYRHITLSLLAHAFLSVMRQRCVEAEKKGGAHTGSLFEFKQQRGLYYL